MAGQQKQKPKFRSMLKQQSTRSKTRTSTVKANHATRNQNKDADMHSPKQEQLIVVVSSPVPVVSITFDVVDISELVTFGETDVVGNTDVNVTSDVVNTSDDVTTSGVKDVTGCTVSFGVIDTS